jgi:hypothetical protein
MSNLGDDLKSIAEHKKRLKEKYGAPCHECLRLLPKANPKILMPQGYCKMHKYKDTRPELTDTEWLSV